MVLELSWLNSGKPCPFSGEIELDAGALGSDVISVAPVKVEGVFTGVTRDAIRLTGRIDVHLTAYCAMCLEEVACDLALDLDETLVREGSLPSDQADDTDRFTFTGNTMEMDELIRVYVLLALPMRYICENGCRQESIQEMNAAAAKARKDISPFAVLLENIEEV